MLLRIKNLRKTYKTRFSMVKVEALKDINFEVEDNEFIAIMGESGSGKTTLLNMISLLDRPTDGSILLKDKELTKVTDVEVSKFRRENMGFVFQNFNLLDTFNARDNISLPLVLAEEDYKIINKKVEEISKKINIENLLEKYPYELSGGEKQRVAISRALVSNPKLLLADEPTGALDSNTSSELLKVFKQLNENGQTIIMVTHSVIAASNASRVLFIKDGQIFHQLYKADLDNLSFQEKITNSMQMLQGR